MENVDDLDEEAVIKKLTVPVPDVVHAGLTRIARKRGVTMTDVIRTAIARELLVDKLLRQYGDLQLTEKRGGQPVHQVPAETGA